MTTIEIILSLLLLLTIFFSFFKKKVVAIPFIVSTVAKITSKRKLELSNIPESSLARTIQQQALQIDTLEKELKNFKRKNTGINLRWAKPRNDKAAYLLLVHNDSSETIYNIECEIEEAYKSCCTIYSETSTCNTRESVHFFFLPGTWARNIAEEAVGRQQFVDAWLSNKMQPVKFTVTYSSNPSSNEKETLEIFFTRDNLSEHLKKVIVQSKTHLSIV